MATLSKGYTFGSTETVTDTKLHNLVDDGSISNIVNADIGAAASIALSKLALSDNATLSGDITFTGTVDFSGATVSDLGTVTTAVIEGGTIDDTIVGGTTPAAGTFTDLEATTTLKLGTTNQGDVLYDNGTSLVRLTPGTDGQFLKTQGADANPEWDDMVAGIEVFTSDGTFTSNAGTTKVYITMIGGGAGGASSGDGNGGGGGSAGSVIINYPRTVTASTAYSIQVGDGGAGGAQGNNDGSDGQDSAFDTGGTPITATGGNKGVSGGGGGAGGTCDGGFNATDGSGAPGTALLWKMGDGANGGAAQGGGGGSSIFGSGGTGNGGGGASTAASANTGAGGGGNDNNNAGAAGGSGIVIVMY